VSFTSAAGENVVAPSVERITKPRRLAKNGRDQASSTNDATTVPSASTTGISPNWCRLVAVTSVGRSNVRPPSLDRATNTLDADARYSRAIRSAW